MRQWMMQRLAAAVFLAAGPTTAMAQFHVLPPQQEDPWRSATAYNATRVGRDVPLPALNRPVFRLSCELPNQNRDPFVYPPHALDHLCGRWGAGNLLGLGGCGNSWFGGLSGIFGGGCDSGCASSGSLFDRFRGLFGDSGACCAPPCGPANCGGCTSPAAGVVVPPKPVATSEPVVTAPPAAAGEAGKPIISTPAVPEKLPK